MTRRRYLRHLTLNTGDVRDSYRDEIADDIVAMLRPLLDRAAAGERVPVPGDVEPAGCTITAAVGRSRALLVTVWGPPSPSAIYGMPAITTATSGGGGHQIAIAPLVTFGVAPDSLAGATLWREWDARPTGDPPAAPWCAVHLWPTIALHPEAARWLDDLERCCAWTWIDR